jgi:putative toxin-antitoxin system antitoxin component (TIGR02293 family)
MTTSLPNYATITTLSKQFQLGKATIRQILGISESTQHRYEKSNPILKPAIADRLERLQRITQQALDLFEDETEAQRWLSTPKKVLGGKTPLESLTTDQGSQQVEEMLYRTEYGIFS